MVSHELLAEVPGLKQAPEILIFIDEDKVRCNFFKKMFSFSWPTAVAIFNIECVQQLLAIGFFLVFSTHLHTA